MAGAFSRAMKDISVRVGSDGARRIGGNAAMDRQEQDQGNSRYNGRGDDEDGGGRWTRGGFRGRSRGRGRGGNRGRGRGGNRGGYNPRSRFEEDEDEDGDSSMENRSRRYNPYGGSGRNDNSRGGRDRSPTSNSGWWKVIIPTGASHNKDFILNKLKKACTVPYTESNVHSVKESLIFFVDDESAAKALRQLNNTITTRDGKIGVITKPSDPPRNMPEKRGGFGGRGGGFGGRGGGRSGGSGGGPPRINNSGEMETDPEKIETLKEFLSKRYDPASVKLDLSNIGSDQILRGAGVDTRIWNSKLMNTILHLVNELCPQLKSLDISNNRVQRLDILASLSEKCPDLEELNLSKNQIRYLDELAKVSSCKNLTKLWFSENPAKENYENDDSGYVSAIRLKLPVIKELDGVVLPPPITFDLVANEAVLPKSQKTYTCNKKASELVVGFLKSFFQMYDAADPNDRQNLLQAYHNDAVFSLCAHNTVTTKEKPKTLNDYFQFSRNLSTLKDMNKKASLIKHKKLSVVALFTELPQTKHQFDSFLFDVSVVTPTCLMFTVHGVFLEGKDMTPRGFTRSFIAVPESESKFLIINDELQIRQVTDKQLQSLSGVMPQSVQHSPQQQSASMGLTSDQESLLTRFMSESGMNAKYSLDCLSSNNWNFELAASKFNELKQSGGIPADAFLK